MEANNLPLSGSGHADMAAMWNDSHFAAALRSTAYLPMHMPMPTDARNPSPVPFPLPAQLSLPAIIGASHR